MRLPYVNETIARRVNGILRKSSGATMKVAWTSGPTVGDKLITSALSSPPCPAGARHCHTCDNGLKGKCTNKNVIYKISCKLCGTSAPHFYIGESVRPIRYRFNEHLSDARLRKPDTPLGEHVAAYHTNTSNIEINQGFKIEIIGSGRDCAEIKIAESIHIRNLKPTLNIMRSSWPLVH